MTLRNRGICFLGLEIDANHEKPGEFAGFTNLGCAATQMELMMQNPKMDPTTALETLRRATSPTSAILSGQVDGDSIVFRATENIGVAQAINACDMRSLTVKPFGVAQLAVEWQQPPCDDGQVIMQRLPR